MIIFYFSLHIYYKNLLGGSVYGPPMPQYGYGGPAPNIYVRGGGGGEGGGGYPLPTNTAPVYNNTLSTVQKNNNNPSGDSRTSSGIRLYLYITLLQITLFHYLLSIFSFILSL